MSATRPTVHTYVWAMQRARRMARQWGEAMYVVRDGAEYDAAFENDLDGFHMGAVVVDVIHSDGMAESERD